MASTPRASEVCKLNDDEHDNDHDNDNDCCSWRRSVFWREHIHVLWVELCHVYPLYQYMSACRALSEFRERGALKLGGASDRVRRQQKRRLNQMCCFRCSALFTNWQDITTQGAPLLRCGKKCSFGMSFTCWSCPTLSIGFPERPDDGPASLPVLASRHSSIIECPGE